MSFKSHADPCRLAAAPGVLCEKGFPGWLGAKLAEVNIRTVEPVKRWQPPTCHICHLQISNQKTQIFICNRYWKLVLFKVALPIFPAPPRKQLTIRSLGKSKVTSWLLHSSFSIDTTRWYKSLVPKRERWPWNLLYHNLFCLEWDRGREREGT